MHNEGISTWLVRLKRYLGCTMGGEIMEGLAMTKANKRTAYLSSLFHQEVLHWHALIQDMKGRLTFLAEIVQRLPINHDFTNASNLGAGCVWLTPNLDGTRFV